ncbi:MAG: translation elongation factor Ts [Coprothermobacterota bacterium]|nr:translation elongation factor Ts [Coprothermobacterota bacterium]
MEITASMVNKLRQKTGAGMMDCKNALKESEGEMEKAIELLRTKGLASAAKKLGREAKSGQVISYIHHDSRLGVLLELNCETDFVARTNEFKELGNEICLQIAAEAPIFVSREQVPAELIEKEKVIYRELAIVEGKPEAAVEKIIASKVENFYRTNCLLEMQNVRDSSQTIGSLVALMIAKVGENIRVRRFARFRLGEEI